jgi:hypothetical protein
MKRDAATLRYDFSNGFMGVGFEEDGYRIRHVIRHSTRVKVYTAGRYSSFIVFAVTYITF